MSQFTRPRTTKDHRVGETYNTNKCKSHKASYGIRIMDQNLCLINFKQANFKQTPYSSLKFVCFELLTLLDIDFIIHLNETIVYIYAQLFKNIKFKLKIFQFKNYFHSFCLLL